MAWCLYSKSYNYDNYATNILGYHGHVCVCARARACVRVLGFMCVRAGTTLNQLINHNVC